jgi:hypothetical protein
MIWCGVIWWYGCNSWEIGCMVDGAKLELIDDDDGPPFFPRDADHICMDNMYGLASNNRIH